MVQEEAIRAGIHKVLEGVEDLSNVSVKEARAKVAKLLACKEDSIEKVKFRDTLVQVMREVLTANEAKSGTAKKKKKASTPKKQSPTPVKKKATVKPKAATPKRKRKTVESSENEKSEVSDSSAGSGHGNDENDSPKSKPKASGMKRASTKPKVDKKQRDASSPADSSSGESSSEDEEGTTSAAKRVPAKAKSNPNRTGTSAIIEKQLHQFNLFIRAAALGVNIFKGLPKEGQERLEAIREALEDKGYRFAGKAPSPKEISAEKRKTSRKKELEDIDTSNIITTSGRPRRSNASAANKTASYAESDDSDESGESDDSEVSIASSDEEGGGEEGSPEASASEDSSDVSDNEKETARTSKAKEKSPGKRSSKPKPKTKKARVSEETSDSEAMDVDYASDGASSGKQSHAAGDNEKDTNKMQKVAKRKQSVKHEPKASKSKDPSDSESIASNSEEEEEVEFD